MLYVCYPHVYPVTDASFLLSIDIEKVSHWQN